MIYGAAYIVCLHVVFNFTLSSYEFKKYKLLNNKYKGIQYNNGICSEMGVHDWLVDNNVFSYDQMLSLMEYMCHNSFSSSLLIHQ